MALSKTVETVEARATDFDNRLRHFKETLREVPNRKKGITASSWGQKTKEVAPRARFELATLRLTVAASVFPTDYDDLLSCWFFVLIWSIGSPL